MNSLLTKINNFEVKPLMGKGEIKTWKYKDVWGCPYIFAFLVAPRGGGKTTLLNAILFQIGGKKSKIYIFSSTLNNDLTMKAMIKKLDKNGIKVGLHSDLSLDDEENSNMIYRPDYVDMLDKIYDECQVYVEQNQKKLESEKYLYPIAILIFDDMCEFLKHNHTITEMALNGRHIKICVFIANQYYINLGAPVRANIGHMILFGSIGEKKLKDIYEEKIMGGEVKDFDKFLNIYNLATHKKYDFLFVDVFNNKFYKNFNYLIDISKL